MILSYLNSQNTSLAYLKYLNDTSPHAVISISGNVYVLRLPFKNSYRSSDVLEVIINNAEHFTEVTESMNSFVSSLTAAGSSPLAIATLFSSPSPHKTLKLYSVLSSVFPSFQLCFFSTVSGLFILLPLDTLDFLKDFFSSPFPPHWQW